jgi:hypothetical protein
MSSKIKRLFRAAAIGVLAPILLTGLSACTQTVKDGSSKATESPLRTYILESGPKADPLSSFANFQDSPQTKTGFYQNYLQRRQRDEKKLRECLKSQACGEALNIVAEALTIAPRIPDPITRLMFINGLFNGLIEFPEGVDGTPGSLGTMLETLTSPSRHGVCKEYTSAKAEFLALLNPATPAILVDGALLNRTTSRFVGSHQILVTQANGVNLVLSNMIADDLNTDAGINEATAIFTPVRFMNADGGISKAHFHEDISFLPMGNLTPKTGDEGTYNTRIYDLPTFPTVPTSLGTNGIYADFSSRTQKLPPTVQSSIRTLFTRIMALKKAPQRPAPSPNGPNAAPT